MKRMDNESVDLIATDPPYRITSRGGSGTMSGYITSDIAKKGRIFKHNDIDIEQYLPEFYRILKQDAHCYIMCNNLNLPHFFDVISKSKFHFVKLLVWDKRQAICGKYYMGQVEHIFFLRKGKDKPVTDCGISDLIPIPLQRDRDRDGKNMHDSQKPVALFELLIRQSTANGGWQTVFDPFLGSGTTAIAAIRTGRNYIGCEMDEKYYKLITSRIEKEKERQLTLF
jgi:site-specific DNA-methyltransferase (adenine-specific)